MPNLLLVVWIEAPRAMPPQLKQLKPRSQTSLALLLRAKDSRILGREFLPVPPLSRRKQVALSRLHKRRLPQPASCRDLQLRLRKRRPQMMQRKKLKKIDQTPLIWWTSLRPKLRQSPWLRRERKQRGKLRQLPKAH